MGREEDWEYEEGLEELESEQGEQEYEGAESAENTPNPLSPYTETLPDEYKPLSPRHKVFCRLIAYGNKHVTIAKKLGYTQSWISTLCKNHRIAAEIARIQDEMFEESAQDRIKALAPHALDVFEEALTSEEKKWTPNHKLQAATWIAEKQTGKAIQQIETKDTTLSAFLDRLKTMQESGSGLRELNPQGHGNERMSLKSKGDSDNESLTTEADYVDVSQDENEKEARELGKKEEVHPADLFAAQFFHSEGESKD